MRPQVNHHPLEWLTTKKLQTLVRRGHRFDMVLQIQPEQTAVTLVARCGQHGLRWTARVGTSVYTCKYDPPSGLVVVDKMTISEGLSCIDHIETTGHPLWCDLPGDTPCFKHVVPIEDRVAKLNALRFWTPTTHRAMPRKLRDLVWTICLTRQRHSAKGPNASGSKVLSSVLPLEMWWCVFRLIDPFNNTLD